MWLWTRQEAKRIDELTIQSGISAETLMETAGQKSAASILQIAPQAQSALVLCGPGHNGGDGFVVARELARKGLTVTVVENSGAESTELRSKKRSEFKGTLISATDFLKSPGESDLVIDGLFGIGLSRPLDELNSALLEKVNSDRAIKIALDTPSGLDVDTGLVLGACFRAQFTLTVGHPKPGFFLNQGPSHCGQIQALDIGFPSQIAKKEAHSVFLFNRRLARQWLPTRASTDNKTRGGRTLIWAGSAKMPGAAILACRAASRTGSGYTFCSEREVLKFSPETIPWKMGDFSKLQAVLIGPGLGTDGKTFEALQDLKDTDLPVVVDADALTVAAREKDFPFQKNWVATPHAGELARILEVSALEIESDRIHFAQLGQKLLGCTVLLKGYHTVVAFPQFTAIVPTGNVALAKGGSGDVLGGIIASLISQGVSPERAALLGAYIHGRIADDWLRSGKDVLSLTPSDLLELLPETLSQLRKQS